MRAEWVLFCVILTSAVASSQEPFTVSQMQQMLDSSQRRSQLEMDGGKPFHLVASYEQFDLAGTPAGKGTIDELWEGPKRYRQVLTVPAIAEPAPGKFQQVLTAPPRHLIEVDDGIQAWRTGRWVVFADVTPPVLQPFQRLPAAGDRLTVEEPPAENKGLQCIGTEPELPGVAPETRLALTTFCLARGNHLLRLIRQPNGIEVGFSEIQPFGDKYIARLIEVGMSGKVVLRIHVDTLTAASDFSSLDVTAPAEAQRLSFHRADLPFNSGELMQGQLLKKVSPLYPQAGLRGTITVKMHVDTSGAVVSADVLEAQNQILKAPVLAAVQGWRFRVSYQGSKLVPVDHVYRFSYGGDELLQ